MIFRKLRGVNLPYREQGLIWFTCVNYDRQPKAVKEKIRRLCKQYGGEHEEALFILLTRENVSISWIERNYYVTAPTLYKRRVKLFNGWKETGGSKTGPDRKGDNDNLPGVRENLPEKT